MGGHLVRFHSCAIWTSACSKSWRCLSRHECVEVEPLNCGVSWCVVFWIVRVLYCCSAIMRGWVKARLHAQMTPASFLPRTVRTYHLVLNVLSIFLVYLYIYVYIYVELRYIEKSNYRTSIYRKIQTSKFNISKYPNIDLRYIMSNAFCPPSIHPPSIRVFFHAWYVSTRAFFFRRVGYRIPESYSSFLLFFFSFVGIALLY